MADRLNGSRVLILEAREEAQFSKLLVEQGAEVVQCPMFAIHDAPDPAPVEAWIRRAIDRPFDDLVLMTGEGLRRLIKVARNAGVEAEFARAIGKEDDAELWRVECLNGEVTPTPVYSSGLVLVASPSYQRPACRGESGCHSGLVLAGGVVAAHITDGR